MEGSFNKKEKKREIDLFLLFFLSLCVWVQKFERIGKIRYVGNDWSGKKRF